MFFRRRHIRRRLLVMLIVLGCCGLVMRKSEQMNDPDQNQVVSEDRMQQILLELRKKLAEAKALRGGIQKGYFLGLNNTSDVEIRNKDGHRPTILIWNRVANYHANPEVCGGHVDCHITGDLGLFNQSDAVVFYAPFYHNIVPEERPPNQLFVWWSEEKNHHDKLVAFENVFNLTFSYRRDSSIYAPYGSLNLILEELRKSNESDLEELLRKKRKSGKIAAWAVSNCAVKERMRLGKRIRKAGLHVDTYGRCFNWRRIGQGRYHQSFYDALSEYKFYLAFENGYHCKDYITEKFWFNGLRSGAVPIVWGAKKEDIVAVAPEHSFIHVDDFSNVTALVDYLNYLSSNETAYRKHLEWRTWVAKPHLIEERLRPNKKDNDLRSFCKLCRILQEEDYAESIGMKRRKMVVPSLHEFWWSDENEECLNY